MFLKLGVTGDGSYLAAISFSGVFLLFHNVVHCYRHAVWRGSAIALLFF